MADHTLDGRKRAAQRALDLVDVLVHLDHAHRRRGAAMEINDFAGVGIAHPNIMDVMDRAIAGKARQRGLDGLDALGGCVGAVRQFRLERFDVGVDLDVLAKILADVALQHAGNLVGRRKLHVAVDLEVDADDQLLAEIVHGDMVDGEAGIAGDHHDALAHALIIARDRHRGEGEVGVAEYLADGILRGFLDRLDAVDPVGAWHLGDGIDEMRRPDHARTQAVDADHTWHRPDRGGGLFRYALRRAVEQRFDGGAAEPQAQDRYHHGNRDGGDRVTPAKAQASQHEPDDDGDGTEHIGGEMQRVRRQRLAP